MEANAEAKDEADTEVLRPQAEAEAKREAEAEVLRQDVDSKRRTAIV